MAKLNVRRGIVRLSIIVVPMWIAFWTWTYLDAGKKAQTAQETGDAWYERRLKEFEYEPQEEGQARKNYHSLTRWADEEYAARDAEFARQEAAYLYGLWGVLAYALLLVTLSWIYVGFRSDSSSLPQPSARRPFWRLAGWRKERASTTTQPSAALSAGRSMPSADDDNLDPAEPKTFDGKRSRRTLYWGTTLATAAEFVLRSALSGGEDRGTNVLVFVAVGLVAWLIGRLLRSEMAALWAFGSMSLGFLGLSLARYGSA